MKINADRILENLNAEDAELIPELTAAIKCAIVQRSNLIMTTTYS